VKKIKGCSDKKKKPKGIIAETPVEFAPIEPYPIQANPMMYASPVNNKIIAGFQGYIYIQNNEKKMKLDFNLNDANLTDIYALIGMNDKLKDMILEKTKKTGIESEYDVKKGDKDEQNNQN